MATSRQERTVVLRPGRVGAALVAVWAWLRLDLRRRWRSVTVVAVVVALSSGVVMAASAGARRGSSAMDRLLARTLPATALVQPNDPGFDWAPVRRLPGVAALGTLIGGDIRLAGSDVTTGTDDDAL